MSRNEPFIVSQRLKGDENSLALRIQCANGMASMTIQAMNSRENKAIARANGKRRPDFDAGQPTDAHRNVTRITAPIEFPCQRWVFGRAEFRARRLS